MHIKTSLLASLLGGLVLAGCASTAPSAPAPLAPSAPAAITATATATATPSVKPVPFNRATSGKLLAAKIATRAKTAGMKVTGVECKNFAGLKMGTATDCQMRVNGVKQGIRATFTLRDGHYVLKAQKLTW